VGPLQQLYWLRSPKIVLVLSSKLLGIYLPPAKPSSVMDAIREATDAIPNLTGDQKLIFEAHHWDYLGRYRPQQAQQMAHALAVDGKNMDFNDPKFVQQG
jgi:hypothetical protein